MDRWERIRITSAIVASALAVFAIGWFTDLVYTVEYPVRSAYKVPDYEAPPVDLASVQREWPDGVEEPGGFMRLKAYMGNIRNAVIPASVASASVAAAPEPQVDLGTRLAQADKTKGAQAAKVCATCHDFTTGGPNRVGPNLWGVVGRPVGSHAGFQYSKAMAAHGGAWTYEELDAYLTSPARDVPGNKMSFAGIRKASDRANVLAWLGSQGSGSVPLPKPQAQ